MAGKELTINEASAILHNQTVIYNKERKKDEQFGSLANFQFSTSAMLFCEFDSLVGYRTTEKEG